MTPWSLHLKTPHRIKSVKGEKHVHVYEKQCYMFWDLGLIWSSILANPFMIPGWCSFGQWPLELSLLTAGDFLPVSALNTLITSGNCLYCSSSVFKCQQFVTSLLVSQKRFLYCAFALLLCVLPWFWLPTFLSMADASLCGLLCSSCSNVKLLSNHCCGVHKIIHIYYFPSRYSMECSYCKLLKGYLLLSFGMGPQR